MLKLLATAEKQKSRFKKPKKNRKKAVEKQRGSLLFAICLSKSDWSSVALCLTESTEIGYKSADCGARATKFGKNAH